MEVHVADEREIQSVFTLRVEVFVGEQKVPPEIELDEDDSRAVHLIAKENGITVGCARILEEENSAHLGRIAVKKEYRGRGIGAEVCRFAIKYSISKGMPRVWLNSQLHAVGFYEKLGFRRIGETFFEAGIEHVRMEINTVLSRLFALGDPDFRDFNAKLIPNIDKDTVIGVRTPYLRKMAKEMIKSGEAEEFISEVKHGYFEENQLHAFIISEIRDFDSALYEVERFLPYIDNWATADQLTVKAFARYPERLLSKIEIWIHSGRTYTVRYAIGLLMRHFSSESFDKKYPEAVSEIVSEEYYINMMSAWYFATLLSKHPDEVTEYFEKKVLPRWVHNKAIQKAVESRRVSAELKAYLKTLVRNKSSD